MAPEILGGDKYNMRADMWSLGIIIFEIITYMKPFHGQNWLKAISEE
jgi:serine/threonine-protein kinase ULK/ATG1